MNEDKSARYHRLQRRASIASAAWTGLLLGALVFSGASLLLRDALAAWWDDPAFVVTGMVLVVFLLSEALALPLAFYANHVLEHRYGLSRQTAGSWLVDHVKALAIGLVLTLPAAWFVYWTMRTSPAGWWVISALGFSIVLVVLANLAPVVLLPLFFKFTPLDRPELRDRLERLAERAGARVVGVYRWDLGAKTSKANAALAGLGGTRRILLSDTMLEQYSDDEIEVVLAHELAHHVHGDIWKGVALETALMLVGFGVAHAALTWFGTALGLLGIADPAGVPLVALALGLVSLVLLPIGLGLSRRHERHADRFALDLTGNPAAFTSAMRRLGAQNLAEERPSRLVQWLFYSHPPLRERLEAAAAWGRRS